MTTNVVLDIKPYHRTKPKITYNSYMSYRNIVNNYLDVFFKNIKLCNINVNYIKKIYGEVAKQHKSIAKLLRVVLKKALCFATMLLNRGFSVKAVSFMLGHSSTIITTDIYYDKICLVIDFTDELNEYIDKVKPINKINEDIIDFATNFNKIFKELQLVSSG